MPVYVYRNLNTHETFEVEQRITEDAWTRHPESGDPVKRLVQPVGIAFKGSGFYVTDSRGGGAKTEAKPAANGASSGGASEGGGGNGSNDASKAGPASGAKAASNGDSGSSTAQKKAPKAD